MNRSATTCASRRRTYFAVRLAACACTPSPTYSPLLPVLSWKQWKYCSRRTSRSPFEECIRWSAFARWLWPRRMCSRSDKKCEMAAHARNASSLIRRSSRRSHLTAASLSPRANTSRKGTGARLIPFQPCRYFPYVALNWRTTTAYGHSQRMQVVARWSCLMAPIDGRLFVDSAATFPRAVTLGRYGGTVIFVSAKLRRQTMLF